jgi:hypothetical protein
VLPYVFEGSGSAGAPAAEPAWVAALRRLRIFYDVVFPILALLGLAACRAMPAHARRVLASALAAGGAVLVLRYVVPAALRDAKEIELMLAPLAVLTAAGLSVAWTRGRAGRAAAGLAVAGGLGWALVRDVTLYAERFVAIGR